MIKAICDHIDCTGCGACTQICPKRCIQLTEDQEGFWYPTVDADACVECGLCAKVCPANHDIHKEKATFYMCWNKDTDVLLNSSSGGAFTSLAKTTFDRGGIVFGAYQDFAERKVYHVEVGSFEDLDRIRLSKYCQSSTRQTYQRVRDLLTAQTPVLFCGTACQVAGLLSYLQMTPARNKLDLLCTVDILCHGVASQKVVNAFLQSKETKFGKKIKKYHFRVKTPKEGWKSGAGTRMSLWFEDGTHFVAPQYRDTYFKGFNKNIFLRESCYRCRYCGTDRVSDLTLADYWGVPENSVPPEQLKHGVSVMLINTEKARQLLPLLEETLHVEPISPEIAIAHNLAFTRPQTRPAARDRFFPMLEGSSYDAVIMKLFRKDLIKAEIREALVKIIGKKNYQKFKRKG